MKKILLFLFFIPIASGILIFNSFAQMGEWTWMHGDNFINSPGVFGTQGVADPANKPRIRFQRSELCRAMEV